MKTSRRRVRHHALARSAVSLLPLLLAAAAAAPADTSRNTLTEPERRAGWELLFDGRSLAGFRGYRSEEPGAGWRVEDGALVGCGPKAGDLVTRDEFDRFEVSLEFRVAPGTASGVMFHVTEREPEPWMSGPEVLLLDPAAEGDRRTGWIAGLFKAVARGTRPAGKWNRLYLRVTPASGEVRVNGVQYFRFKKGDPGWDKAVAASDLARFEAFGRAESGHICLRGPGTEVAFRAIKIRRLPAKGRIEVRDDGRLAVRAVPAFPDMEWEGWSPETDDGTPALPLRPVAVTHAGDGSGRTFVADQSGMIHVIPPTAAADATPPPAKLFLDLRACTALWKQANEEGLLGLAFHPRFRENGELFVCYCLRDADGAKKRVERVSRFRVSASDPDKVDPTSEEVLLAIDQPYPNHNGGSIAFGPDGRLYIGLGDGGSANDPRGNGQNLGTWLGKILRIDVDRRDPGKTYAVPTDNPFVGREGAQPEIFAFGFRNPWQITFDRRTGRLWAADVGQDSVEEIDIVEKGCNYGWSLKEGTSPFGVRPPAADLVDPIWEYDHEVGKSITGGFVVRGGTVPALEGGYLYGDHVTGRMWALWRDAAGRIENKSIDWKGLPIFGFGQDEAGNVYVFTSSSTGQGVFRLVGA